MGQILDPGSVRCLERSGSAYFRIDGLCYARLITGDQQLNLKDVVSGELTDENAIMPENQKDP